MSKIPAIKKCAYIPYLQKHKQFPRHFKLEYRPVAILQTKDYSLGFVISPEIGYQKHPCKISAIN
jgi:hypothetical protein